jgi:hypothetical protein
VAKRPAGPTHEQIARRAQEIWIRHGCPPGEDKENWFEAEAELKREMGCVRNDDELVPDLAAGRPPLRRE